jgi:hypothetical protein
MPIGKVNKGEALKFPVIRRPQNKPSNPANEHLVECSAAEMFDLASNR